MTENKQVLNELPKPVFTKDTGTSMNANTTKDVDTTKDDIFLKSFKEAIEGGVKIATADMNKREPKPLRRRRLFTESFVEDLAAALEDIIEEDGSGSDHEDLQISPETNSTECVELEALVKSLSELLKKALTLSNKIRWKALSKSDGHYIHGDFFKLRKLISSALYPCIHRIKRVHIPALHHE